MAGVMNKSGVFAGIAAIRINTIELGLCFGQIFGTKNALTPLLLPFLVFQLSTMHWRTTLIMF